MANNNGKRRSRSGNPAKRAASRTTPQTARTGAMPAKATSPKAATAVADSSPVADPHQDCSQELHDRLAAVAVQQEGLARDRERLDQQRADLARQADDLTQRSDEVEARELAADAGFQDKAKAHETRLSEAQAAADKGLEDERNAFAQSQRQEREQLRKQLDEERKAFLASEHEARQAQRKELDAERAVFDKWREEQRTAIERRNEDQMTARLELDRREAEIEADEKARDQQHALLAQRVQAEAADALHRAELRVTTSERRHTLALEEVARLTDKFETYEQAQVKLGNRSLPSVLAELDQTKAQVQQLTDQLASRLSDDSLDRLHQLEEENRMLHERRAELEYEVNQLRAAGLLQRVNAMQVKTLNEAQQQFDVVVRNYDGRIERLQAVIDGLEGELDADPTAPTFPRLYELDRQPSLAEPSPAALDDPVDLAKLARGLQWAMWTESKRAYRLEDVCSFLGGMAMSRLHVLQGISGTGKTSLPLAVARALRFECAVIEVQAGWRDRTDLFGHYNTFERRFHESEFLQALYRARTPLHANRPFFVVLDEMNLSRPEQYFADILSKLARPEPEPIHLVPTAQGEYRHLDPENRGIVLPPNVWFVGTANQDESTLELADKTYNRSYVLELPYKRPFVPGGGPHLEPPTLAALTTAFDDAARAHQARTAIARKLVDALAPDLAETCEIGVSPRIVEQLQRYVPVVVAARAQAEKLDTARDEALAEAVDHFVATKLLQQVRGRYEIPNQVLQDLDELVVMHWQTSVDGRPRLLGEPERCRRVLAEELRRRGADRL